MPKESKSQSVSPFRSMMPLELLVERFLSVMTVLGLCCLCIGFPLHMAGRVFDDLVVARIGAYMLLIGILLVAARVFYWIMEEIVKQGFESMIR